MVSYLIVFDLPTYYMHLNLHQIREIQLNLNFHFTTFFYISCIFYFAEVTFLMNPVAEENLRLNGLLNMVNILFYKYLASMIYMPKYFKNKYRILVYFARPQNYHALEIYPNH